MYVLLESYGGILGSLPPVIVLALESYTAWFLYIQWLQRRTEELAMSYRRDLSVSIDLVISDENLHAEFLKELASQSAERRAWCDWSPVVAAFAIMFNSLVRIDDASDDKSSACRWAGCIMSGCWATCLLVIKLLPVTVHDMGIWWRLNLWRHTVLLVLMATFSHAERLGVCTPVYSAETGEWMKLLKVFASSFVVHTWMEVGGRLQLLSWLWSNTFYIVSMCIQLPGTNMETAAPHILGTTAAMLWAVHRQGSALERFLTAKQHR